ncbi:hypothetical protein Skr01_04950 [Sphaerisporangium krabiense]|nr:hypothetical protein Skr01_04950 [Sphaerisporangium krabiense]
MTGWRPSVYVRLAQGTDFVTVRVRDGASNAQVACDGMLPNCNVNGGATAISKAAEKVVKTNPTSSGTSFLDGRVIS